MRDKLTPKQQFKLCFKNLPEINENVKKEIISDFNFDKEKFKRLLFKTDLEQFTELLWNFGLKEVFLKHFKEYSNKESIFNQDYLEHIIKYRPEFVTYYKDGLSSIDISSKEKKTENLELTHLLIFLLEEIETGINVNFRSNLLNKNFNTKNDFFLKLIINTLINEYVTRKLNKVNLTYEEAEMELLAAEDRYWVREYMARIENVHYIPEGRCFYFEDNDESIDEQDIHGYISTDMIEEYADDHYKSADINLDLLKEKQAELSSELIKKVGAKPKNDNIANISERLSYLIRLDRFFSQDEYNDIYEFPLSNKDCRLIHDYLSFYYLIPDQNSKTNTTSSSENYIKALIKNYRTHRANKIHDKSHDHINSYKKYNNLPWFLVE